MLGFFSQQMVHAVRNRYLQSNRLREAEVCDRLATFFRAKADPSNDGQFSGESQRYIEDLGPLSSPACTMMTLPSHPSSYHISVLPPTRTPHRRGERNSGFSYLH